MSQPTSLTAFISTIRARLEPGPREEIHCRSGGDHFLDACGDEDISQEIYEALLDCVNKELRKARRTK